MRFARRSRLVVGCCWSFIVCSVLCVVLVFVVWSLLVARCPLFVVCCLLYSCIPVLVFWCLVFDVLVTVVCGSLGLYVV